MDKKDNQNVLIASSEKAFFQLPVDALFVEWHLLYGCNHECEYIQEPAEALTEKYSREAVLDAAFRLLILGRSVYRFHIYGGEPTIHPYFPELFRYLMTSGRQVFIALDTNGLMPLEYYASLLDRLPKGRANINIEAHLKYISSDHLIQLIKMVDDTGHFCKITFNIIPAYADKASRMLPQIAKLRKSLPFDVNIRFPLGGSKDAGAIAALQSELKKSGKQLLLPFLMDTEAINRAKLKLDDINCVHIDPACELKWGTAHMERADFKWSKFDKAPVSDDSPLIVIDDANSDNKFANPVSRQDIRKFCLNNELNSKPVRHPCRSDCRGLELRAQLAKIKPAASCELAILEEPALWEKGAEYLEERYNQFASDSDREVFLRRLKAQILGDGSYLRDIALEGESRFRYLPDCGNREKDYLFARIKWSGSPFKLELPDDARWLELIDCFQKALPEYEFHLSQYGDKTILSGQPDAGYAIRLRIPDDSAGAGITFLLYSQVNGEILDKDVNALLEINIPLHINILLPATSPYGSGDELCLRHPFQVRVFRSSSIRDAPSAWSMGVNLAQSKYVCFLEAGYSVTKEIIDMALSEMDGDADLDAVMQSDFGPKSLSSKEALKRFWTGSLCADFNGVFCRSCVLHDNEVFPACMPEDISGEILNLPLLHFARKILVLPKLKSKRTQSFNPSHNIMRSFFGEIGLVTLFHRVMGLSERDKDLTSWIVSSLRKQKRRLGASIRANAGSDWPDEDMLARIHANPVLLQVLCSELSNENSADGTAHMATPQDSSLTWPLDGFSVWMDIGYLLSVIKVVKTQRDLQITRKLAMTDCTVLEIIILDMSDDAKIGNELEELATIHTNIKLGRQSPDAALELAFAQCLSIASGTGVTFLESGDEMVTDDLLRNLENINASKCDIAIYSTQRINPDGLGELMYQEEESSLINGPKATAFLLGNGILPDMLGLIFKRVYLNQHKTLLPVNGVNWKAAFVLEAMADASVKIFPDCLFTRHEETGTMSGQCGYEPTLEKENHVFDNAARAYANSWNEDSRFTIKQWIRDYLCNSWLLTFAGVSERGDNVTFPNAHLFSQLILEEYFQVF